MISDMDMTRKWAWLKKQKPTKKARGLKRKRSLCIVCMI
jgi:hypothetical protein